MTPVAIKKAVKDAVKEAIDERRADLQAMIVEVIEDIGLAHAMKQVQDEKPVSRTAAMRVLRGKK